MSAGVSEPEAFVKKDRLPESSRKEVTVGMQEGKAIIETGLGNIELKFYPDVAPKHVSNFVELSQKGLFHRQARP